MINMQQSIEQVLAFHGKLDQFKNSQYFHIRLLNEPYQLLVIERHGDMVSVAHYYEQNGGLIADPDIEFHYPSWVPIAIQQPTGYRAKFVERGGQQMVDTTFHKAVSPLVNLWARNILAQGWTRRSVIEDWRAEGSE
jgi:hypothetical protein